MSASDWSRQIEQYEDNDIQKGKKEKESLYISFFGISPAEISKLFVCLYFFMLVILFSLCLFFGSPACLPACLTAFALFPLFLPLVFSLLHLLLKPAGLFVSAMSAAVQNSRPRVGPTRRQHSGHWLWYDLTLQ